MDRRSFIKGLIALASAPAIGKYVNVFKTEGAREGIEQVAGQGVDFFNMVIKKVMDEGTLVKEQDRISTFKHPDRPDIVVDVDQTTGSSSVYFDTDEGTKAVGEIQKTMDETTGGKVVEELFEQEEIYGPTGRDAQEGITGGITNLEEFLKMKKGFAAGGKVNLLTPAFKRGDPMPMGLGVPPSGNYADNFLNQSSKTPTINNTNNTKSNNTNNTKRKQNIIEAMIRARHSQETIDDTLKILNLKNGGRVAMVRGGIPKGLQAALQAIKSKFGDDAIKTADEVESKSKVFDDFEVRNPDPKRQMTDEEIREFADEFGLDPSEEYYNWDGTLADARRLLKESEDETKYMYQQYKAGRLDPKSGEKGREKFLEKKLEEAELSGESKLITRDEIEELEELKAVREAAPQMMERLELKARYPGITDDLLDSILIDNNPQRKAEVLATLDEAFTMMGKGKGPDEVLRIIKDMNRTKQADGGSIDGDVSLTIIKIPDISESGVESLFKRR